ncbi:MAG TPA: hemerythrin domain-containing protein, partial [Dehalococcoidia bacterium]|nr:hemerythrin domain-containing protein [Dehalococcoidia bacterium]
MPDALQMLREDHNRVKDIFKQFQDTEDEATKKRLADQAMIELEVHTKLEEEIFYPAVRSEGDTTELMDEAAEEHHVADMLIEELRGMKAADERFDAKFTVLAESVKHHIEEEESEMFPKAAELGRDQ